MTSSDYISQLIAPYGPTLPIDSLVVRLNNLYHSFEAHEYDQLHPEVYEQLPPLWSEMAHVVRSEDTERHWRVIDFGCGTGFEATQVLKELGGTVAELTCYDPSPEMIERCRCNLGEAGGMVRFTSDLDAVLGGGPFELLITNSVLHHLPDPAGMARELASAIKPGGWWINGHEPSRRFYLNPECCTELRRYRRSKLLQPRTYLDRLRKVTGRLKTPAQFAASAAFEAGLFGAQPPADVVGRLVDFHVVSSDSEAGSGRGFDFRELEREFEGQWSLRWIKSYSFMGFYQEGGLPRKWQQRSRQLGARYPEDGANFSAVWRRS